MITEPFYADYWEPPRVLGDPLISYMFAPRILYPVWRQGSSPWPILPMQVAGGSPQDDTGRGLGQRCAVPFPYILFKKLTIPRLLDTDRHNMADTNGSCTRLGAALNDVLLKGN